MKYTIWIFGKDFQVKKLTLDRGLLLMIFVVFIAGCISLISFPFLLCDYWRKHKYLEATKQEMARQVQFYQERIGLLANELAVVKRLEERLQRLVRGKPSRTDVDRVSLKRANEGGVGVDLLDEGTLEALIEEAQRRVENLEQLQRLLEKRLREERLIPSIWPVRGNITSGFGVRVNPFTERREFHTGIDISAPYGAPVIAPADGKVKEIWNDKFLGLAMRIEHGQGIETVYGHLAKVLVKEGEKVFRGQRIALVGNSGRSTGPHLHYEIWVKKQPVNPLRYVMN